MLHTNNHSQRVLVLGDGPFADAVESVSKKNGKNIRSVIFIRNLTENPGALILDGQPFPSLDDLIDQLRIDTVVVTDKLSHLPTLRKQLLHLRFAGIPIFDAPYFLEALTGQVLVDLVNDLWFVFRNQGLTRKPAPALKRALDLVLAAAGLLITGPVILLAAAAVKLTSRGPVFFRQERLGRHGEPFRLLKLRTMVNDAERLTGPRWASKNDPRITAVGRVLRKTRLDELPQLLNILKGEMSFVGPRPIRKCFEDEFAQKIPFYYLRHKVKPGATGWAQIQDFDPRAESGPRERLQYDLYYIQHQSIWLDLRIILETFPTILMRKGT